MEPKKKRKTKPRYVPTPEEIMAVRKIIDKEKMRKMRD